RSAAEAARSAGRQTGPGYRLLATNRVGRFPLWHRSVLPLWCRLGPDSPAPHHHGAGAACTEHGECRMNSHRKLWMGLTILLVASFAVLLWSGRQISLNSAPMPERV